MRKQNLLSIALLWLVVAALHATVYVNTNAPGVRKVSQGGKDVWVNSMGMKLADASEAEPLENIDKEYYANVNRDNPDVKKVWDEKRGCYIWRDGMGNFLGRDLGDKVVSDKYIERCDEYDLNGDPTSYQVQTKIVDPYGTTMQPVVPDVSTESFSIVGTWKTTKIVSVAGIDADASTKAMMMTTVMKFEPNGKMTSTSGGVTQRYNYTLNGTSLKLNGVQSRLQVLSARKIQLTQSAGGVTVTAIMEK